MEGFNSLRKSIQINHNNTSTERNPLLESLLMSSIVDEKGYIMKAGILSRATKEGICHLKNGKWEKHPLKEEETTSTYKSNCLDDEFVRENDFWNYLGIDQYSNRATYALVADSWNNFYTEITARTSHDKKSGYGHTYYDSPADEVLVHLIAFTNSTMRTKTDTKTNDEEANEAIYISWNTCFSSAYCFHSVTDGNTTKTHENNLRP